MEERCGADQDGRSWRLAGRPKWRSMGGFWGGSILGQISGPEGGSGGGGAPPKNGRNSAPDSGFLRNCADPRVKITPKNPFLSSPRRPAGAPRGSRGPPRRPAGTPRGPPRGPAGPPPEFPISGPKTPPQRRTCSKNFLTKN